MVRPDEHVSALCLVGGLGEPWTRDEDPHFLAPWEAPELSAIRHATSFTEARALIADLTARIDQLEADGWELTPNTPVWTGTWLHDTRQPS